VWAAAVVLALVPLGAGVLRTVLGGRVGVDAIALVAMTGALALGEFLAGAVVALMLAGGGALEAAANGRARRELTALLARAPAVATRRRGAALEVVGVDDVIAGDVLVVRTGEVVAVDGVVEGDAAIVDEAALTGESLPVRRMAGRPVRSGAVNAGAPFDLRAVRPAAESSYAALVRLVEQAQRDRAPFTRLADRYAALLLPVTLATGAAAWAVSGDPVRALAVVVVATPCPLILAAPIAFVCGISRAARRGVIVKGAGVIERLGRARSVLLDKTGTLTLGSAGVERIEPVDGIDPGELLRLAASLDQASAHALGAALVAAARERGLTLETPRAVREAPGDGLAGDVGGRAVALGGRAWLRRQGVAWPEPARPEEPDGLAHVAVAVDRRPAGTIVMADRVREDAPGLVVGLRSAGIRRIAMVTGDNPATAARVGRRLGLDAVHAGLDPEKKLAVVHRVRAEPGLSPVLMVGDGVNDAPALAVADVGIAMAGSTATVSSQTADAVITVDRIDRVADAVRIGRRSLAIATQSVVVGMGLSFAAMGFAAAGLIAPVVGAVLQEGIDLAVILNALRALTDRPSPGRCRASR
jgi:heavy metal translocating P-type ATPase